MTYHMLRLLLIVLVFFDFLFFNIKISFINITMMRVIIIFLLAIIFLIGMKFGFKKPSTTLFEKGSLLFFAFWLIWSFLQLPFVAVKVEAIKGLYYLVIFLSIIFITNYKLNNSYLKNMISLLSYIYIVMLGIGFLEIVFNKHFSISKIVIEQLDIRASTAVFYNQNDFCLYLVMFLPLALYYFKNVLLQSLILLSTIGIIIVNDSFLAFAAIIIQLVIVLMNVKMDFRLKFAYILNLSIMCIAILPKIFEYYAHFLVQLQTQSGSAYVRLTLIKNTLDIIFNKSLLMGVGLNNITDALMQYTNTVIVNPHNWWLELLALSGVFVFTGYVLFLGYILIYTYNHKSNKLLFYCFISIIGFALACISPSSVFNMTFVWLYYGILIAIVRMSHQKLKNDNNAII